MWSKRSSLKSWAALIMGAGLMGAGCSGAKDPAISGSASGTGGGAGQDASGAGGTAGDNASGEGGTSGAGAGATSGTGGSSGAGGRAGGGGTGGAGTGGAGGTDEPEVLDPAVDWTAYKLIYETSYTAYDGVHPYQLPIYVLDTEFELSDWQAIPSSAVSLEEDPENGGVLVTILEPVEEITIAVSSGMLGGSAPIHVTIGTPEEWELGEARYNNGVEYTIPEFDFAMLLDPNFMPPEPPDNLACNNCHTTGAKYFEVQHSPTQAAHYSDEELMVVFTSGMKPPGVGYRILPEMFQDLYADFHTWESDATEQKGLIMYMRSLTPTGQGDIKLPDGSYVPVGTDPSTLPMMP